MRTAEMRAWTALAALLLVAILAGVGAAYKFGQLTAQVAGIEARMASLETRFPAVPSITER